MPALSLTATKPAGGAALDQVVIATALVGVATAILLVPFVSPARLRLVALHGDRCSWPRSPC